MKSFLFLALLCNTLSAPGSSGGEEKATESSIRATSRFGKLELLSELSAPLLPPLLPGTSSSQVDMSEAELSLRYVFNETLEKSPRAFHLRSKLGLAKSQLQQALTLPNPSLIYLEDTAQTARQIGVSIPIEGPWKVAFRILQARRQIGLTELEIQRELWALRGRIRRLYLQTVIAQETQDAFEQLRELSQKLLATAQRRSQAGDVAGLDVIRASLAAAQAEADAALAESKSAQLKQKIAITMGRSHSAKFKTGRLPSSQTDAISELLPNAKSRLAPSEQLIALAEKNRLELRIVKQKMNVNQNAIRLAYGNIIPNTQLTIGKSNSGNPPQGPASKGYFVGVTQEIPVLNMQQGEISRLRATANLLKREYAATRNIMIEEVMQAYRDVLMSSQRIQYFQSRILANAADVSRLSQRSYEVGQTDISTALLAQQASIDVRQQFLEAVACYQQSLTDLEQAVGMPL